MIRKLILTGILILGTSIICSPAIAKNNKQKSLPPGLQKKIERGKELPPGWQKKIARGEVLDIEIYKRGKVLVPADINDITTIQVEDKTIRLIKSTREIVDILE